MLLAVTATTQLHVVPMWGLSEENSSDGTTPALVSATQMLIPFPCSTGQLCPGLGLFVSFPCPQNKHLD